MNKTAGKNKYLESLKRRVMVFDNNFIFRRWISSELCFQYFTNLVLYTTLTSNGNFFMDLTNIEGIERLECITVFTEVASKLSSNLHLFCTQPWKVKKKLEMGQWRITWMKACCLLSASLHTVKVLSKRVWCDLSEIYLIAYALWHGLCLVCTHAIEIGRVFCL